MLLFLIEHAPLERWERDVLEIIRDEAYYFAPQAMTKIMNEGWATYWHSKIMTEKALSASEIIDYADHASGVTASSPGQLNPYKLGVELYRHIEERWNKGQFGKEWDECDDMAARKSWDRRLGLGKKKIFEVRKLYNDITFIDEFFTEEFCRSNKFFSFGFNERSGNWEIESREFKKVKDKLLFRLTNFGQPFIYVEDGNFENRGELLAQAQARGHGPQDGPRARHARGDGAGVEAAGEHADARRRQGQADALRRARSLREGRRLPRQVSAGRSAIVSRSTGSSGAAARAGAPRARAAARGCG